MAAGEFADEITPVDVIERFPNLATGEAGTKVAHGEPGRRRANPTPRSKAWRS